MKTKPITIEPGSGTKLAGKNVVLKSYENDKTAVYKILYVGQEFFHVVGADGDLTDCVLNNDSTWLEILPDDLPQDSPKEPPVHNDVFKITCRKYVLEKILSEKKRYAAASDEEWKEIETRALINAITCFIDQYFPVQNSEIGKLKSEGVVK